MLVPVDGSKNLFKALTKAIFLAKTCDSSITALHVLHTAFDNSNMICVPQTQNESKKVEKFLATAKNQVTKNSIKFKKEIIFGHGGRRDYRFCPKRKI